MGSDSDSDSMSHSSLGFRFLPTKYEILFHLRRKIDNPDYSHPAILEADVYAQQPEGLPWYPAMNYLFHGKERYFFHSRPLISTGKRTNRTVGEAGGSTAGVWHGNSGTKPIHALGRRSVVGYVRNFTFFVKDNAGKDKKTNWIMHEFVISKDAKQQWALSRIRFNSKEDPLFASSTSECLVSASNVAVEISDDDDDDDIPLTEPPSKLQKTVPLKWIRNGKDHSCCRCVFD